MGEWAEELEELVLNERSLPFADWTLSAETSSRSDPRQISVQPVEVRHAFEYVEEENCQGPDREICETLLPKQVKVEVVATEVFRVAGISAYHTSIILGNQEFFFDSGGIESAPAFYSHFRIRQKRPQSQMEVVEVGQSLISGEMLIKALGPFFQSGSYDLVRKNCNSFTDVAMYFLTRTRLESHYRRLEQVCMATAPVSTGLLKGMLTRYSENPLSDGFNVEDIIALFETLDRPRVRTGGCFMSGCLVPEVETLTLDTKPVSRSVLPPTGYARKAPGGG